MVVRLFPDDACMACFHDEHEGRKCPARDNAFNDPLVGGDPTAPPRACGCDEYTNKEMRGRVMVVTEADKSFSPWTDEQVEALRQRQANDQFHPYTCPRHSQVSNLVPHPNGWLCEVGGCDYWQGWAHSYDVRPGAPWE